MLEQIRQFPPTVVFWPRVLVLDSKQHVQLLENNDKSNGIDETTAKWLTTIIVAAHYSFNDSPQQSTREDVVQETHAYQTCTE